MTIPTIPDIASALWGNTAVSGALKTSLVTGAGFAYRFLVAKSTASKSPLIIALHGVGECGTDGVAHLAAGGNTGNGFLNLVATANPENSTNFNCYFAAPQTPNSTVGWSSNAACQAIHDMLQNLLAQYPNIDQSRIILTGLSMGGFGAYDIPYLYQQMFGTCPFSCTVPMSGFMTGNRAPSAQPNIPIRAYHSVDDPTVAEGTEATQIAALRALGRDVTYFLYKIGEHAIWPLAYQDTGLLAWMFAQTLGQPSPGFGTSPGYVNGKFINDGGFITTTASAAAVTPPPVVPPPASSTPKNYSTKTAGPGLLIGTVGPDQFGNTFTTAPVTNPLDPSTVWTCVGPATGVPYYGKSNTTAQWEQKIPNWGA